MSEHSPTLYDEVLYPSAVYAQTHPDRLATIATLFGMNPAPVENCRVLELGCNNGTNLIAMAYALPRSQFLGIDLAGRPIAAGQGIIRELGLSNISLRQLDLMQMAQDLGLFDYIIAHGLYSWIPEGVRDKLLAVCNAHLTENGVAYVSYNVYPGCHFRDLSRGMMRYHAARFSDPDQKISQARELVKFLAESKEQPEPYHEVLKMELDRILARSDAGLFHDDLNAINQPVYFYEFIEHASRHGLQYLAEVNLRSTQGDSYPPDVLARLKSLHPADVITREQYGDFIGCRSFRQTLLCRREVSLDRSLSPGYLHKLRIAAEIRPASPTPDLRSLSPEIFKGPGGSELETNRPIIKTALNHLGTVWPQSLACGDLLRAVQSELFPPNQEIFPSTEKISREIEQALFQAYLAGYVELHAHRPRFVATVSERPKASALARFQLQNGIAISTLRHQTLKLEDALSRHLVLLLDGTRDRATLLEELCHLVRSGAATVTHNGEAVRHLELALAHLSDGLDANLTRLACFGVLVG